MVRITFKCPYRGSDYSCHFWVESIICQPDKKLLVCTENSTLTGTFVISSYKQFNVITDDFVVILSPNYYNSLVRIILDIGVHVFDAVAVPFYGGVY